MRPDIIIATATVLAVSAFPWNTEGKEDGHLLKGRIINQDGVSIEYVAVGIPGKGIGTISSADGIFELEIPEGETDSLEFQHVSYLTGRIPASEYMHTDTMCVTLTGNEIETAVVYPDSFKEKTLVSKGARFPMAYGSFRPDSRGTEVGSNVKVKKPFIIRKFSFKVARCTIEGTKVSLNVYRITDGSFRNILHRPIYIDIAECQDMETYEIAPEETLMLEPGEYFVSLAFIGCSEKSWNEWKEQSTWTGKKYLEAITRNELLFPLYFKSSYTRDMVMDSISRCGLNIGMSVSGLEYTE